ncbi:MAG: double-cubane-cluster-containing anaerobic reductase [Anaeromicrobium sp.]|jgi:benzoyl-CoA reductase/2-hydroxyglutaryl-CoA dehydratase subunit BcrC/BadD/HgdB|uniref:double-cubane-cluster-containing anaerobic reductase n=1 Tax=Anaeromicrobium sp. TaxID=1929132 RepID=UPI0025DC6CE5|nr:double-cubane-cluster-containing anaerobic reductase [Anaeromicrobium sp.]MCT4595514.1 double-cubane-cluster-containing anaerobic reductase [Anaeromicrobium sp.]
MNELPSMFNEYDEARQNGFIEVKKYKESGKKVVGTFCTYTPKELIHAAGGIAVSLCGTSNEPIADAEIDLPANLCPLIKSSYGFAITDKCPYFYFSDLIVGETTCDGKKKMYELLGEIKPMHVMQLPQNNVDQESMVLWKKEIMKLKDRIEKDFHVEITPEKLKEAINIHNEERKAKIQFYELGKLSPSPVTGMEILKVLYGSQFKLDKRESIDYIKELTAKIKDEYENGQRATSPDAPRILVTGCPIGGATEKAIQAIEENGGVVVCYENCGGVKANSLLVDEDKEPIEAIAEKYLSIPCSVMSPNTKRLELLSKLIDEYKIDGVVEVILQACHTYNVEATSVKRFVNREKNIPYINIETDYSQNDIGQLSTRMGAFLEMLY